MTFWTVVLRRSELLFLSKHRRSISFEQKIANCFGNIKKSGKSFVYAVTKSWSTELVLT